MRTINNNRVLVQCVSKEDKDRFLTAVKEKTNTLKVSSPKKRNPNVLLKNLPNEISDHDVLQLLKDQNPELEEKIQLWEETKICFTLKKFENSRHLVLEMNPNCRNLCLNLKFLRANWNVCKIQDFIAINRCFISALVITIRLLIVKMACAVSSVLENTRVVNAISLLSPFSDSRGTELIEFISVHNLFVINEDCGPTFCGSRGSSYIDVTAVGTDLLEDISCWHLPDYDSLSDHKAIEFDIALDFNSPTNDGDSCIFNLKKANWKLLYDSSKFLLSNISDLIVSCQNPESLHDLAKELISIILNSCKMSVPIKKRGMHRVPWWTTEIGCMRKHVNAARRRFQRCKNVPLKEIYKIKQQFQKRIELSGIALPSGAMSNSFEETINEVIFHSFPDDCENEDDDCHKEIRSDALIYISVTDDPPFTIHEINAVINKLKLKKAPGPDSIPNEVVKKLHEMYPDLFLTVFNSCLRLKTFPRCWKKARIILIPKVNDVCVPKLDNLRCISLLSTLGKCFERLIINRVAWRLYKDNYFNKNQFGFMPHKCTEDALSAFDNAWWTGILNLLKRSSIPGNLFAVISSFLKNISVTLSLGHSSKEKFLNKGCPQGSVSGPFLWNGKSFHDICRQAQLTLDFASTWTKNLKLEFNAVKSKVMFLEKRDKNALTGNLTLNGCSLDCVKELKYLGVVLDSKYCWKQHVLHLSNKCEKILLGLNKVARNSFGIKSNVSSLIYKQGIVPFICYGSQIWGSALKKKMYCRLLRKIQRRILLRVISGYRTISYEAVFAISGFPPIDIFIIRNKEFKIATKNCTNKCLDGSLRVSELPHPSERFPLNLVNYRKNIENNFPVVCFTDGRKINTKVGLAFVIFQDFIEIGTRQFLE
ncbi:retrovirus-related Pol polyprotein from type-1 retrotransposable element R1 [Trichonephila clavipes]|nr:retrovirus-related Pol polyprotein from type-1 retrotransposable element R1 [Trichonephila clavipes]